MNGIQLILISGIAFIFVYYVFRFKSAFMDLLLLFVFSALGVFFILFPENTNLIAHRLGVGRGADLLFYICILLFLFITMKLFARIRRLEKTITQLVRNEAKKNAVLMDEEIKTQEC